MTTDNQKYEITNQAHPHYPWLHRIRALKDVREGVKAGTLGGYVQSADISHRTVRHGSRTMRSAARMHLWPGMPA